jgi:hypothetical protein
MLAVSLTTGVQLASAQTQQSHAVRAQRALPQAAEQALAEANRASFAELSAMDRKWRDIFRASRHRETLKGFVGETLNLFEKLRQVHDFALNPGGTDARVTTLFRKQIMDADTVCTLLEKSLADYCRTLDEQDQALFIKLKIDREAGRTSVSRSVIDPASFKKPIHGAASAAVVAVQNDMARSIAAFAASEAIGAGVKRAARDLGINRTEEGSFADFITGLVIDLGVNAAVDAATDPTPGMVADLETRLQAAERTILDGTIQSPGFITTLRRITDERAAARRQLLEAELLK